MVVVEEKLGGGEVACFLSSDSISGLMTKVARSGEIVVSVIGFGTTLRCELDLSCDLLCQAVV